MTKVKFLSGNIYCLYGTLGMVVHTCKPSYPGDGDRRMTIQGQPRKAKLENANKRIGGVTQAAEGALA